MDAHSGHDSKSTSYTLAAIWMWATLALCPVRLRALRGQDEAARSGSHPYQRQSHSTTSQQGSKTQSRYSGLLIASDASQRLRRVPNNVHRQPLPILQVGSPR
jgi:hypothetical protein